VLIRTVDSRGRRAGPESRLSARRAAVERRLAARRAASSSLYLLVALLVVLNLTGVVMVLSASTVLSIGLYHNPWHFFAFQVLWLIVGSGAFVVALRVDHHRWRRLARPLMLLTIALLVAVLVPGIGKTVSGATRWVGPSPFRIQPSELAKFALVLYAADILDRRSERGERGEWRYQMGPVVIAVLVLAALVLRQPDMGTTLVLSFIAVSMLFAAGLPLRPLAVIFGVGVVASVIEAIRSPYRLERITSFLHPLAHASDSGYQASQALGALAHGSVAGDGIGVSAASWGHLPNAYTDFIFAVIGEETGLVGTVLLSALFLGVALVGVRIASGARDRFSGLLAAGITAWLAGQAVLNIGAVVGLLPVTGVPLPFVSFGGSSTVIALFAAGVLGNVARQSSSAPPNAVHTTAVRP
jgi:cell division protein FtsW